MPEYPDRSGRPRIRTPGVSLRHGVSLRFPLRIRRPGRSAGLLRAPGSPLSMASTFRPRPFRPSPWARGPHAQTLWARALRAGDDPGMVRERWKTPDGDFLEVDFGPDPGTDAPLALVLHGLEGSSRRKYVLGVCRELLRHGVRPVAMNFRGCGGTPNLLPRFYHSGETQDPAFVLARLRVLHPERRLGAFGFSLGANMLLKMLGEREDGGEAWWTRRWPCRFPSTSPPGVRCWRRRAWGGSTRRTSSARCGRRCARSGVCSSRVVDVEAALVAPNLRLFDDVGHGAPARLPGRGALLRLVQQRGLPVRDPRAHAGDPQSRTTPSFPRPRSPVGRWPPTPPSSRSFASGEGTWASWRARPGERACGATRRARASWERPWARAERPQPAG